MSTEIISDPDIIYTYLQKYNFLDNYDLNTMIKEFLSMNPYNIRKNTRESIMWKEQCIINFPILYLASIYLYIYAKKKGCDIFLFATRDSCHWYMIFKRLFPECTVHYFHCSRNMFEKATYKHHIAYDDYVKSIVKNKIEKVIFIDIHGTCKRMFTYFSERYGQVPYGFLLSSTHRNYYRFPQISRYYKDKGKFINIVFNARGSPCESLNYDTIGTLQDFCDKGPIRDKLEYTLDLIEPYHKCMNYIFKHLYPLDRIHNSDKLLEKLEIYINKLFNVILYKKPSILKYIKHIGKHKKIKNNIIDEIEYIRNDIINNIDKIDEYDDLQDRYYIKDLDNVTFNDVLSCDTVYGLIWKGKYKHKPCVIKMLMLKTGLYYDKDNNVYIDSKGKVESSIAKKSFIDEEAPFLNSEFKNHKALDIESFNNEVKSLSYLTQYGLSPELYQYSIINRNGIDYGFIVMERADCSIKDILLKRSLNDDEKDLIKETIYKLHYDHNLIHGDLKPSNIGVFLDDNGYIVKCIFIDCQKMRYCDDDDSYKFNKLVNHDLDKYDMHFNKNIKER